MVSPIYCFSPTINVQNQDPPEPKIEPPGPAPPTSTTLAAVKEEERDEHLPPAGSVDNPMEIDDSDGDGAVGQASRTPPKRRMNGLCIVADLLCFVEVLNPVSSLGGETPAKRLKSTDNCPPGSKNPNPPATLQSQGITTRTAEPPKEPVRV